MTLNMPFSMISLEASTIAMPLAVDAVSNVTGVPQSQLADLVTTLNQANVQPTQFVEVIRYVPVALEQPGFVQYVQTQSSQGVTGDGASASRSCVFCQLSDKPDQLAANDLAVALTNWPRIATNVFDGSGNFSLLLPFDPSLPARFFAIQVP